MESRRRLGDSLKATTGFVPFIPATLIGAGYGFWYGAGEPALIAAFGALVLAAVTRFLEGASAALVTSEATAGAAVSEVDAEVGVRRPSQASLEAAEGRAGIILLLAASRFWVAMVAIAATLLVLDEHRAALIGGFVAAVVIDTLQRLRKGLTEMAKKD